MKRSILVLAIVMALMAFTAATALAVPKGPPEPFPPRHSDAFLCHAPDAVLEGFGVIRVC